MPTPRSIAVIVTALTIEQEAVVEHLRDVSEEPEVRGSIYRRGIFGSWDVIVAEVGAGNERASAEAERAIAHYSPEVALFVGVAGAVKDLQHGDVVASTKVYAYESGKDELGGFRPRPSVQIPNYALEQRARYEAGVSKWRQRIKGTSDERNAKCVAKVGPIAAGEKVLASNRSQIFRFLRANYGDAIAVEMEGHGFLLGVQMNHPTQGIVIRGISDCLSDKDPVSDENWQPIAARNAAAFAFELLAKLPPKKQSPTLSDEESTESLIGKYCEALRLRVSGLDWWKSAMPIYATLDSGKDELPAREILLNWAKSDCDHCVVLGNPGSGKSGLLRWLAYEQAAPETNSLPVIISAAKLRPLNEVTLSAIGKLAEPQFDLTDHCGNRQLLVLLDGLDELVGAETGGEAIACQLLTKLCSAIPASTRVIAACRTPVFPALADELRSSLPNRHVPSGTRDIYDLAISRAIGMSARPPLVIRILPVQQADAESFLRIRLPHSIVDANVHSSTIRPFLTSPFSIRLLSLALPCISGMGSVSIVDLYGIYMDAALLREQPDLSQRDLSSIVSTLRDLAESPNTSVNPDHARLARNAGLIVHTGSRTEFSHYTLWEYLFADKMRSQMVAWDSRILSRYDLVNGYNLNRFLVPMMLSELATRESPVKPRLRVVSSDEYREFLRRRNWRKGTGYGYHPSSAFASDGTPSATFAVNRNETWSIHDDATHGAEVASAISWYDAAVFALHCNSLLPTSDQLRSLQRDGDYAFWGAEWYDEDRTHICGYDTKIGKLVGMNPDVRLPRTALAVFG